jgi:hypothetical protein
MKKLLLPFIHTRFDTLRQAQCKTSTSSVQDFDKLSARLRRAQWSQLSASLFSTRNVRRFAFILHFSFFIFHSSFLNGQTIPPPYINYQAVLYDVNNPIPNSVFDNESFPTFVNINDELGNLLYREEHFATTDGNGLITVKMGDGAYVAGSITNFNQINWETGKYYLVVDFNINGTISSTAPEQLVTVPYSFYSGKAGNGMASVADNGNGTLTFTYANGATYTTPPLSGIQGPAGANGLQGPAGILPSGSAAGNTPYWNGTAWETNNNNIYNNGANVGIGQTAPTSKFEVSGAATNSSALNSGNSGTINFSQSNLAFSSFTGTAYTLTNLKNGGAYSLVLTSTTNTGIASFTAAGFTVKYMGRSAMTSGKAHIYSFIVAGTVVYVSMATED